MTWQTRVIHWLAVHRATQLWTTDRIVRRWRVDIARRLYPKGTEVAGEPLTSMSDEDVDTFIHDDPDPPFKVSLLVCWWCVGMWASIGLHVAARRSRLVREHLIPVLAASSVAVIVHDVIAKLAADAE